MPDKPHLGRIENWTKLEGSSRTVITGLFVDHPNFAGEHGRTSYVLSHDETTGEIETRNSRYTLVGEPAGDA